MEEQAIEPQSIETEVAGLSHPPDLHLRWQCPTCGSEADGHFCANCGEGQPGHHDLSMRHLLSHSFETLFHFDSKIGVSLRALLRKPGMLSCEFASGRRKPYLHPFQLFFVMNLLFFLVQPLIGWNTLTTPLDIHLTRMFYSPLARRMVATRLEATHLSMAEFAAEFNHHAGLHAKSLVILMVPMLALVVWALNLLKRRYFAEHVVFSLHFYSFWLVWLIASLGITTLSVRALLLARVPINDLVLDNILTLLGGLVFAAYLATASRRFYNDAWWAAILKGILLAVSTLYILQAYRSILFFTTFFTL